MEEVQEQSGADSNAVAAKRFDRRKLRRSFGFAFMGIVQTWRTEQNFRIEVIIGVLALGLGVFLRVNLVPIILCCLIVLSLEIINSALEATLDLLSPEPHPLVKRAKDAGAGAVLLAAIGSTVVGLLVLGPPLWVWLWLQLFGGVQ